LPPKRPAALEEPALPEPALAELALAEPCGQWLTMNNNTNNNNIHIKRVQGYG
jgi:hypothetical protein